MDQLVAAREPFPGPGGADIQAHLDACPACRAELERLHQRVARMKALPSLRSPRDRWPVIRDRLAAERRARRARWGAMASFALAASLVFAVLIAGAGRPAAAETATQQAISQARAESVTLEDAIRRYGPDRRVMDGHTARLADELEGRISALDQRLEATQFEPDDHRDEELLRLWRERVGLLDALVDVHVTKASAVGL
jgi:hypothetical protein